MSSTSVNQQTIFCDLIRYLKDESKDMDATSLRDTCKVHLTLSLENVNPGVDVLGPVLTHMKSKYVGDGAVINQLDQISVELVGELSPVQKNEFLRALPPTPQPIEIASRARRGWRCCDWFSGCFQRRERASHFVATQSGMVVELVGQQSNKSSLSSNNVSQPVRSSSSPKRSGLGPFDSD